MKKLWIVLIIFFVGFACAANRAEIISQQLDVIEEVAPTKSLIDPYVVGSEWEQQDTVYMNGNPVTFFINPDETADVQCAALATYYALILAYIYLNNDYIYFFWYDRDLKDYRLMDCHQDQWKQNFKIYCSKVNAQLI